MWGTTTYWYNQIYFLKKAGCNWCFHRQPMQICWNHPPWVRQILFKSWSLVVKSNAFCKPGNCMEQVWNDMSCLPPIARTWQWKNKTAPRVNQNNKAVHKCLHVNTRCHPVSSVPVLFGYHVTIVSSKSCLCWSLVFDPAEHPYSKPGHQGYMSNFLETKSWWSVPKSGHYEWQRLSWNRKNMQKIHLKSTPLNSFILSWKRLNMLTSLPLSMLILLIGGFVVPHPPLFTFWHCQRPWFASSINFTS